MTGSKILSTVVENLHFLDSLIYLPMSLKSMPKTFHLARKKGYYIHFFNTANKLVSLGSYPEPNYFGAGFMSAWCKGVKKKNFNAREELLAYRMDDVSVLRQVCCAFRYLF